MNKTISLGIVLYIQCIYLFATPQIPDTLIYNGREYDIINGHNPMEFYFNKFPEKRPPGQHSTALWRGYIATFEIMENELWVVDIKKFGSIDMTFGRINYVSFINQCLNGESKIKIDWFNGLLILPQYRRVELARLRLGDDANEYYIKMEIRNGELISQSIINREQYIEFIREQIENSVEYVPEIREGNILR